MVAGLSILGSPPDRIAVKTTCLKGDELARPNYNYEKRRKELAKKKKREEKKQRKLDKRSTS